METPTVASSSSDTTEAQLQEAMSTAAFSANAVDVTTPSNDSRYSQEPTDAAAAEKLSQWRILHRGKAPVPILPTQRRLGKLKTVGNGASEKEEEEEEEKGENRKKTSGWWWN